MQNSYFQPKIAFDIFSSFRKFSHLPDEKQVGSYEMEKFIERMEDSIKCFFGCGNMNSYLAWKGLQEFKKNERWNDKLRGRNLVEEERKQTREYEKKCIEVSDFRKRWGY